MIVAPPFAFAVLTLALAYSKYNTNTNNTNNDMSSSSPPTTIQRIDLVQAGGFVAGENLVTVTVDAPIPLQDKEVLIDIQASAVNPVDWKQASYNFLVPSDLSATNPAGLGCDVAGVVVGPADSPMVGKMVLTYLGADKTHTKASRGAYGSHVVAETELVFEVPSKLTAAQAVTLPVPGLTAGMMVEAIGPAMAVGGGSEDNSTWIAVWGSSSAVGFFALQLLAQKYPKCNVVAIASGQHKATAMGMGATAFVDYRTEPDVVAAVTKIVQDQGGTMNAALDCIGTDDTFAKCAAMVDALAAKSDTPKIVSSVNMGAEGPNGVKRKPVNLGNALDTDSRAFVIDSFPELFKLKPQKIRSVKGPVEAKTVEEAFQLNKDGVSGEKVVIEWTK